MKLVTAATMRELDRATIAGGTSGAMLMERAGVGAAVETRAFAARLTPAHRQRYLIVAGKGNNGGDGYVVARYLAEHDAAAVDLFAVCPPSDLPPDARAHAARLPPRVRLLVGERLPPDWLTPGTVVVDALLGTGISGPVREPYATLIAQVNASQLPVVALDLPSGVNADDGSVGNVAICADLTVTMGLPKAGLFMGAGLELSGRLRCVGIGLAAALVAAAPSAGEAVFAADVAPLIRRLPKSAHKGTMGTVLVVGGSSGYPGAPLLAGLGALRFGAGLVTVAYPASIGPTLRAPACGLILAPVADGGCGYHHDPAGNGLAALAASRQVLAIGPGLGRNPATLDAVRDLLATDRPVVLDADGLHVLARHPTALPRAATTVLTPHPGEFRRLAEALGLADVLAADRATQARTLAQRLGAWVVLKGAATVIAAPDGTTRYNSSGCPALATGGSGDVLTGVLAAALCQCPAVGDAVALAVFGHGLAGELAPHSQRALIADDLPALLGPALTELSPHA